MQEGTEYIIKQLSHYSFFGNFAQQRPEAFVYINELLNLYNFSTIIEIGTHDGGLSVPLAMYCYNSKQQCYSPNFNEPVLYKNKTHHKQPKEFHTFDIFVRDESAIELIKKMGGNFHLKDCFEEETFKYIVNLIQQPGRTLLLCDGGDKIKEVNSFIPHLKVGDIIMGHDYFRGEEEEELYLNKIWYGKELSYADIKDQCEKYSIEETQKQFDQVVWFCGEKTK